ncbi:hypothetical protein [Paenibacillus popilliae]|nr:hypothetical protein [Paenibacillus popilliae]
MTHAESGYPELLPIEALHADKVAPQQARKPMARTGRKRPGRKSSG